MKKTIALFLFLIAAILVPHAAYSAPPKLHSSKIASCIRRTECQRMFYVAHRANGFGAPENSAEAVKRAVEAGVPIIEVDVRSSKDGYLYVMHDATLDRTASANGKIAEKTSVELENISLSNGEPIPMLQDIYDLTTGKALLNLDFKVNAVTEVAEWVEKTGSWDDFIFFVNNKQEMLSAAKMKSKYPEMIVMARLTDETDLQKIKRMFGHLPEIIHTDFTNGEDVALLKSEGAKTFVNDSSFDYLPKILKFPIEQQILSSSVDFIQTDNPKSWKKKIRKLERKYEKWFNFGTVYPERLLRSSAPSKKFLRYLKEYYGINIVIDLRSQTSPIEGPKILQEKQWAEELGLKYVSLHTTSSGAVKNADYIKRLLEENGENKILVHCQGGKDRTGALVAYLRMQDGWTYEEAKREMEKYGHNVERHQNFHERLQKFYEEKPHK